MAVQQGRNERSAEAYPLGYVEGLSDARTKLADFFSILLVGRGGAHEVRVHSGDYDDRRSLDGRLCQSKEV